MKLKSKVYCYTCEQKGWDQSSVSKQEYGGQVFICLLLMWWREQLSWMQLQEVAGSQV